MINALYPYQRRGAEFLANRKFALLADEMGVGKTPQAIAACDLVKARTIVVVCPAIARINWQREVARWQATNRPIRVVERARGARILAGGVTVTSYAMIKPLLAGAAVPIDVLILDEAHYLKSHAARRTREIYGAKTDGRGAGLMSRAARVWLLTGTPQPNNASELWTHLHAAGAYSKSWWDFRDQFCDTFDNGYSVSIRGTKTAAIPKLIKVMQPFTLRRQLTEVLPELPPMLYRNIVVHPSEVPPRLDIKPEEQRLLAGVEAKVAAGGTLTSHESMHLATLRRWTGAAKAPAVAELLREDLANGLDKVVVFAVHRTVLDTLSTALADHCVTIHGGTSPAARQAAIDRFQADAATRVFLCQLSVGATALTLTAAAHVVFAETSWTPGDVAQAVKRCHRLGQSRPVIARIVTLAGSLDEKIAKILTRKAGDLSSVLDPLSWTGDPSHAG